MAEVETIDDGVRRVLTERPPAPRRETPQTALQVPPSLRTAAAVEANDTLDAVLGNLSWRAIRAARNATRLTGDIDAWMALEQAYDEKFVRRG